jgi:Cytidylate kinase
MNMVFAITRQYGSGGHEVGKRLATALEIPFYDRETITLAVKESDVGSELFGETDKRAEGSLLSQPAAGNYTFDGPNGNTQIYDKLFMIQAGIIERAARQGPCVIVGQCADYVLRSYQNLFSVFIHADKFERMDRVVREYRIAPEKAAESLIKKDKQRADYYNFYTNQKWDDFDNYDLAIDSSAVGIDQAVDLIRGAAEMKEQRRRVATGKLHASFPESAKELSSAEQTAR